MTGDDQSTDSTQTASRRKILGSLAVIGGAASVGLGTWAALSDTEVKRVFGRAEGGLDLKVDGQDGVIRVPDSGSFTLAGGESFRDSTELTNVGSVPGDQVGVSISTRATSEGDENPESETNTDPSDGGEFDDNIQIKAFVEQAGTVAGYFFGASDSYAAYNAAEAGGQQLVTLSQPLDNTTTATTNLIFEVLYPTYATDAIGDTIEFDLAVTLNQTPPAGGA